MTRAAGFLVKVRGDGSALAATNAFGAHGVSIEPILRIPAQTVGASGFAASSEATWLRVGLQGADAPDAWEHAHDLIGAGGERGGAFAAAGRDVEMIEPDFAQGWLREDAPPPGHALAAASAADYCAFADQSSAGGQATGPGVAWNLDDVHSGLAKARDRVGSKLENILIAHLDTGFDPNHVTLPAHLLRDRARNFVAGEGRSDDASDQTPADHKFAANRGHGTATLALLAGNKLDGTSPHWPGYQDFLGGAPLAQVIPVRIADWVVRFSTGSMVAGFNYAREKGVHVLSMSMGGLSSQALVDAVNLAYEAGIVLVTAAGNNYSDRPSPKSIVFPARYRRVLAACGVMADGRAYTELDAGTMQGNYGPTSKMETALAAYTPNVPWAKIDCGKLVNMDGSGTSAATPQIAAAAALWLAEHWDKVKGYSQPWMRVEAVRRALFSTAHKQTAKMNADETQRTLGQGIVRAEAALASEPAAESQLQKQPPSTASWSWINLIFGGGVSLAPEAERMPPARRAMLALELTQMAQRTRDLDEAMDDPDRLANEIPAADRTRYLEEALDRGNPSRPLRALLEAVLKRPASVGVSRPPTPPRRMAVKPPTPFRRLRVYALDPSVAKSLSLLAVNETVLSVPWDETPERKLQPGPIGEYLEVIDIDPASDKVYDPVNLNNKELLAQDGWAPSEGNPEFHQQMVYAVAMTTIAHFERALGRRALWAPHWREVVDPKNPGGVVPEEVLRLRLYPHALRTDNAYYSPDKKALLFGYFPADSRDGDATAPGSMVFSCLSSDIIAHEMSHALLDGLHRRFEEVSNPDVPAFHEGFADIVALFQHFTVTELVRFEIARARGVLSAATLLGGLAKQFGEGASRGGPLRNYNPGERPPLYSETQEPHARGSILVFAVYEAFLNIVSRRSEDLIRLATGGTGVLPLGALHPDLVNRLTIETCKAARHVLQMCIRALDYCPPIDITFGSYLRAIITADIDVVPNDRFGYRVAFMEAFRKYAILPHDVRTISPETLAWNQPIDPDPEWLRAVIGAINVGWNRDLTRSEIYELNKDNCRAMHIALQQVLGADASPEKKTYGLLGLVPDLPRYNAKGQEISRPAPGQTTFEVHSVRPARRVTPDGGFRTDIVAVINQRRPEPIGDKMEDGWFWFRGGTTLIIDGREADPKIGTRTNPSVGKYDGIRFSIAKSMTNDQRLARQRACASGSFLSPLRALYFGDSVTEPFAMMHAARSGSSDND